MPEIVGKQIGPIGYGTMGLTFRQNPPPTEQAFKALRAALDSGCNFWNSAEFYGLKPDFNSLTLLASYFKQYPEDADKVVLSVKGCYNHAKFKGEGTPEAIKRSIDNCLKYLNRTKKIDMFACARVDPDVPLEITLKYLKEEYVDKGVIGGIALSEVSAETIRHAAKITKIVAVEVELSLWATDILENGVAAACRELDIPIIAYSPIGQGMLSGQLKTLDDLAPDDFRRYYPKFQASTFPINIELVNELRALAEKKGCTPAQLAINWVKKLSERPDMPRIIPIPGATTDTRVRENAQEWDLTAEELSKIDDILAKFDIVGRRYPEGWPIEG